MWGSYAFTACVRDVHSPGYICRSMTLRTPNLFLIGAMRAGTTALHETLSSHPQVFMSSFKEPAHFADPAQLETDSELIAGAGYAGDWDKYLALFANAGGAKYVGESSTHYTKLPRITGVAGRIAAVAPEARLIYLVRDPVARTLSHYRYAVRRRTERRPLPVALRQEPFYGAVSNYAMQLEPYLSTFGADRVYVLELERLARDTRTELEGLFSWLGLAPSGADAFERRNEMPAEVEVTTGPDALHRLGQSRAYRKAIRRMIPEPLLAVLRRRLLRPLDEGDLAREAAVAYLRELHEPEVVALEVLLGRSFEDWSTLRPA